ncbi:ABC transporter permease [Pseudoxanthobacter sp. M-2]|uniref:ABC transporter permease n=1 Tax=Pseudoxanthobacter sp. M-2 TaxID=3078754 RepID=UPI0038FCC49E
MTDASLRVPTAAAATSKAQRYYTASQWQLVWWRFRRHRMAIFGAGVLLVMAFMGVFAGFIAPYGGTTRDAGYVYGPPQMVRFWDQNGFSIRPFVFGMTSRRDPVTLRMITTPDPDTRRYLSAFVRGDEYRLLGLFSSDIHLFGVDTGMVHLLGTDDLGRDLFSRLMFATWTSLSVGLLGVALAFVLALVIGGVAGFYGGAIDDAIQRFTEVVRVVPAIPLFMGLTASFPQDWSNVQVYFMMTLVFGLLGWTTLARRVRGHILSQRREDYVLAAEISGASPARIIGRHLLPSFTSYIVVDLAITFPYVILSETALSFVGLGLRPPSISWGILLQDAQNVRAIEQAPWLFIPAAFVVLAVLAFTIIGDGLRDAADPYQTSD